VLAGFRGPRERGIAGYLRDVGREGWPDLFQGTPGEMWAGGDSAGEGRLAGRRENMYTMEGKRNFLSPSTHFQIQKKRDEEKSRVAWV
jgi:hypothetical protein